MNSEREKWSEGFGEGIGKYREVLIRGDWDVHSFMN